MTEYTGIDYGRGLSNIDHDADIRYGVISQNEVLQAWSDSFEPYYPCKNCDNDPDNENDDCDFCEPTQYYYDGEDCIAESDSYGDIFITRSLYYTYAQFCSPCAPGACHLEFPLDEKNENNKCYCFDHSWFDDGKAPYTVYSVETNEIIKPERK